MSPQLESLSGPDGRMRSAGRTFERKVDAQRFLTMVEPAMQRGEWNRPCTGQGASGRVRLLREQTTQPGGTFDRPDPLGPRRGPRPQILDLRSRGPDADLPESRLNDSRRTPTVESQSDGS
jgi:hypothetical protein